MATYRGVLTAFNPTTFRATVRLDGSSAVTLDAIHATRLDAAEYAPGRRVLVDTGDHGDPGDVVVVAVWG